MGRAEERPKGSECKHFIFPVGRLLFSQRKMHSNLVFYTMLQLYLHSREKSFFKSLNKIPTQTLKGCSLGDAGGVPASRPGAGALVTKLSPPWVRWGRGTAGWVEAGNSRRVSGRQEVQQRRSAVVSTEEKALFSPEHEVTWLNVWGGRSPSPRNQPNWRGCRAERG